MLSNQFTGINLFLFLRLTSFKLLIEFETLGCVGQLDYSFKYKIEIELVAIAKAFLAFALNSVNLIQNSS